MESNIQIRKFADDIWKLANMGAASDPFTILEHLSYLLYFRFYSQNEWLEILQGIQKIGLQYAIERYESELLPGVLWNRQSTSSQLPFVPSYFGRIVQTLDDFFHSTHQNNPAVDLFDLLQDKANSNKYGVFLTPRILAKYMAKLLVETGDFNRFGKVCDPACGTGTLLISLLEQAGFDSNLAVSGYEINSTMSKIAQINMFFRDLPYFDIHNEDSLSLSEQYFRKYDYVITNPPIVRDDVYSGGQTWYSPWNHNRNGVRRSYQFIELALGLVSEQGRAAIIVPEGLLSSSVGYDVEFRRFLVSEFNIDGVVSLPSGILSGTALKTSILLVSRRPIYRNNRYIWFYSFDQKPNRLRNDERLWEDMMESWRRYTRYGEISNQSGDNSWLIDRKELEQKQFQLTATTYRRYIPEKNYRDPNHVIKEILDLRREIDGELDELSRVHFTDPFEVANTERESQVIKIPFSDAQLNRVEGMLADYFSEQQKALFDVFMNAEQPLAIHEAAKLVNSCMPESTKLGVQEAKQFVELFESLGLIDSVPSGEILYPKQSSDEDDRIVTFQEPITLTLWMRTKHLRRN